MKGQATDCEKMFLNHVSNKGSASRTCKELLQLNNKMKKKKKMGKRFE